MHKICSIGHSFVLLIDFSLILPNAACMLMCLFLIRFKGMLILRLIIVMKICV